jgi:hypothetical protein
MYSIYLAYTYSKLSLLFRYLSRYGMVMVYTKFKSGLYLVYTVANP